MRRGIIVAGRMAEAAISAVRGSRGAASAVVDPSLIFSDAALRRVDKIMAIDPLRFVEGDFVREVEGLHYESQTMHGRIIPHPFGSDTGSSLTPVVMARQAWEQAEGSVVGFDPEVMRAVENSIKGLFLDRSLIESERKLRMQGMKVYFTSSTTQANKVAIIAVGNVNAYNGEVALASEHSHIFGFEVGQPAEKVIPKDKVTGKLTIEDLEEATRYYSDGLGKRVKVLHLDQPTNGDFFYSEDEIKALTTWAHARGIAVTMDIERLTNFLPIAGYDSYFDLTAKCGVDVVSLGMQKNGGARSSTVVVLDDTHLSDPRNLDQRVRAFFRLLGDVTNNRTFVVAGWEEMASGIYLENAAKANAQAKKVADVIAEFDFEGSKGEVMMQNYPLTTNMIFIKFPKDFVSFFNRLTDHIGENYLKLSPSRQGVTRIVASHDVTDAEADRIIFCLKKAYEVYLADQRGEDVKEKMDEILKEFQAKKEAIIVRTPRPEDVERCEVGEIFKALMAKAQEGVAARNVDFTGRKFTTMEVPLDPRVLSSYFLANLEGYHFPYGHDKVSEAAATALRETMGVDFHAAVVFTSSKSQAITCLARFLQSTDQSAVLVSPGSARLHTKFGRAIKAVELSGEFKDSDKLDPKSVDALLSFHNGPKGQHVQYLTGVMLQNPTSTGHVYSPEEIKALSDVAHKHGVPLVMEMAGASYFLTKTGATYRQYTTDCGVDAVTLGLQGIGGSPASAIMVLDEKYLRWKKSELQLVLDRTVKENGGRQSTALTHGWEVMMEKEYWRVNASIANANVVKLLEALQRSYEFDGKPMEFQNLDPANNIVAVKLPQRFMDCMNKRGYELWSDSDGYVKIRAPYHVTPKELDVFNRDFQQSYEEYQELEKSKAASPRSSVTRGAAKKIIRDLEFGSDRT